MHCKHCNFESQTQLKLGDYCCYYCLKWSNIEKYNSLPSEEKQKIEQGMQEEEIKNRERNRGVLSIKSCAKMKKAQGKEKHKYKPLLEQTFVSETQANVVYHTAIFPTFDSCTCKGFTFKDTKRKLNAKGYCKHTKELWDQYNFFNS